MASIRGEVPFKVEDGPRAGAYTLLLDFNALCDLEDVVPGLMDGNAELSRPTAIRSVFHAALKARHPDVDLKAAGEIIQSIGIAATADLVQAASEASFGSSEGKDSARPQ
jgi:hypothetical protein